MNWRGVGSNPAGDIYFHFEFSLPPRSEQVNGAVANEIKHVHSPEVIVVLDSRYDLSYKALYISTCSIALTLDLIHTFMIEIMEMLLCNVNRKKIIAINAYIKPLFDNYGNLPCKITYFVA